VATISKSGIFQLSQSALLASLLAGLLSACAELAPAPERLRETADIVEVGRFSQRTARLPLPEYWQQYIILPSKPLTQYTLVDTGEGVALEANAEASASGLYRKIRIDPARHPVVSWRWRVAALIPGADKRRASAEDSPARLVLSFHGDPARLDVAERGKMRLARAISGREIPYATLMYVVSNELPVGTLLPNPHTDRIQMLVVASGEGQVGQWTDFRRNVLEDYRRAFGEEPWDIVAVGVMTDADNTGKTARCHYGDISFLRADLSR
jgi:hypothetical protein